MSSLLARSSNAAGLQSDARRERRHFLYLSLPAVGMVMLGAILPVAWIIRQSFLTPAGQATTGNYEALLASPLTLSALLTTLELSFGTLILCLILGIPLAFALATTSQRTANRLMILVLMPLWTSILVRTYAWLVLLRRDGVINHALINAGLIGEPMTLVYNFFGTFVGMVQYMLPLFVLPVYAAMRDVDRNTVFAAASMGASLNRTFWTVILPLSAGGIASGATIVFVYTLGFFITPAVLGGGHVAPIAIRIERTLSTLQNWGGASALGVMLCILVALIGSAFVVAIRLTKTSTKES